MLDTTALAELAEHIALRRPNEVVSTELAFGELTVNVTLSGLVGVIEFLRSDASCRFSTLIDITAAVEELPNLWVLAPAAPEVEAAELLQDAALATALDVWRDRRPDAVEVIDTAPLLGGDAALATLPLVDAILLVADGRRSTAADMAEAERLLRDLPPILGVILNKSED